MLLSSNLLAEPLIRIATYNIKAGLNSSIEDIGRAIAVLAPDIIAIQEVDEFNARSNYSQTERLREITNLEYYYYCHASNYKGGKYGHLVLSKFPIEHKFTFRLPSNKDKENRSLCCQAPIISTNRN